MLKVEKIKEKVELLDLEVQSDPCKVYYDAWGIRGEYDCLYDCYGGGSVYGSDKY